MIPDGNCESLGISKTGLEDKDYDLDEEKSFHDAGSIQFAERDESEDD